jgi:hypothetical protein
MYIKSRGETAVDIPYIVFLLAGSKEEQENRPEGFYYVRWIPSGN